MEGWAEIIAKYLKPGGIFFIAELHPFMWVFDDEHPSELKVKYTYWSSEEPTYWEADGSYADQEAKMVNKGDYEWAHPISEIMNALIKAGLTIQEFKEYPYTVYQQLPFMKLHSDGYTRLPGDKLPLLYSIKATKNN